MNRERLESGLAAVRERWPGLRVRAALILGSGWSPVADALDPREAIPFDSIPGLGAPGVEGHAGRLLLAEPAGLPTLVFQGRRHFYEGLGWEPVAMPVFIARSLDAEVLVLTNAAGGIRPGLEPGRLMVVEDHVHRMHGSPLAGPHDPFWGDRFPDQSRVYDPDLCERLAAAARAAGADPARGVYLSVTGPAYETPAEIRAYAAIGADAVGMSTTPEAQVGRAAGLRVCALCCITNPAAGLAPAPLSHGEVTDAAQRAMPRMRETLAGFWRGLRGSPGGEAP